MTKTRNRSNVRSIDLPLDPRDRRIILEVSVDNEVYNELQMGASIDLYISVNTKTKVKIDVQKVTESK